jgi:Tol biopolymer transport system component
MFSSKKMAVCGIALVFVVLLSVPVAMSQFPGEDYDIYAVHVPSGYVFRVSGIPNAGEYNPTWSPIGIFVAHDVVGGPAPDGHAIYITNIFTGTSGFLTGAEGGNDAAWSPNGKKIAFDRLAVGDQSIYVVPACGGNRKLVRADALDPDWAPNSKRLVFFQPSDGSIRTMSENGESETLVGYGRGPVWSPDGRWIAYDAGDIWKIRVTASGLPLGAPVNVTNTPDLQESSVTWSYDSKTIAFNLNLDDPGDWRGYGIWTIPANGGTPKKVADLQDYGDFNPSFSKIGKFIAYAGYTSPASPLASGLNSEKHLGFDFSLPQNDLSEAELATANPETPATFSLLQNYPNPFNPETEIRFELPEANHAILKIYNSLGQEICTLVDAMYEAGFHSIHWDGKDKHGQPVANGVYVYRLQAGTFSQVKKMSLLK